MIVPLTPVSFLHRAVKLYPHKLAVVCGARRFTYREFHQRVHRLSHALASLSIQKGDVVAYLGPNCHRLLEAYYGVVQAGAILLPLNIRLVAEDFLYIINHSEARLLLLESQFLPAIDPIRGQLAKDLRLILLDTGSHHNGTGSLAYDEHLDRAPAQLFPDGVSDENEVAELFYTSGTTDRPKGVMLTHRNLYLHAMNILWALKNDDREVQLHTIPLFHANGWGATHTVTAVGGTHVILRKFDPKKVFQLVQDERVTTFNLVPTMAGMLLREQAVRHYDLSSLRLIHLGGSAVPKEMVKALEERFRCEVSCGYGLTETSPVLTVAIMKGHLRHADEDFYRRAAATGLELLDTEVRVVDDAGADVPADGKTVGEIITRGNIVMKGYWKQPDETHKAMADGWFHTGDLATIDSEGYILIVDRKKDIIVRGGENISSIEVERVLYAHPAVAECAVVAVPDDKWGETPKAFVVLNEGVACTSEELRQHCKKQLAAYKVPASFEILAALPKGGSGKIQKRLLRQPYWARQEKQVH